MRYIEKNGMIYCEKFKAHLGDSEVLVAINELEQENKKLKEELELKNSWVKHHQKSVENKFAENRRLKELLFGACVRINRIDYGVFLNKPEIQNILKEGE